MLPVTVPSLLVGASLLGLASGCCTDVDQLRKCSQRVGTFARPTEPSCYFDPFDNDRVVNKQTVSLTWDQARNVCLELNASLPLLLGSYGTRILRDQFIDRGRFWIGLQRNGSTGLHQYIDLPPNVSSDVNWTNWAKYEPNNAGCVENCAYMNYDGTWHDYACNFIPDWDRCNDVINTICQDTQNSACVFREQPQPIPLAEDWYVILAITFGGIIGVVTLIISARFVFDQCAELRK